jgi:hypothetical protein
MQMSHALPAVCADICYDAKSTDFNFLTLRYFLNSFVNFTDDWQIANRQMRDAFNMFFRDDEDVNWSLGIEIPKRNDRGSLIDRFRVNFAGRDFTKNTVQRTYLFAKDPKANSAAGSKSGDHTRCLDKPALIWSSGTCTRI